MAVSTSNGIYTKHYIKGHVSEKWINYLLNDLHYRYSSGNVDIPLSVYDMKKYLDVIPRIKPHHLDSTSEQTIFMIKDVIPNVMVDCHLVNNMVFNADSNVVENIVAQLKDLWNPHYTNIANHGLGLVTVRLAMFLDDTPQRNETCTIKNYNAEVFCHQCMACKSMGILPDKSFLKRNVPRMRKYFETHRNAESKADKDALAKRYSIRSEKDVKENPIYALFDLYQFDIHKDSPVDLFHVTVIGLFPTTISLINEKLTESKRAQLTSLVSKLPVGEFKLEGQ